jgi:NAD(P)H-flavin reductase
MPVREHLSDHDQPGDLPLVTESATVTRFDPLDHGRNDAVERAVADRLSDHGEDRWHRRASDGDVRVDWRALREALEAGETPDSCAGDLQVLRERHQRPYPSLATVRLDVEAGFDHLPGQYLALRYGSTPRAYSVASPPSADEVELCMRRVPGGELTGELFERIAAGDEVTVRGPCGHFVPERPSRRDVAFLATGTGIAPLKSMLEHLLETGQDVHDGVVRDLWVFLGTSWRDDLAYRDRFRALDDEHDHVHFVPTCTREHLLSDWDGEDDYVQQVLVKYLDDDVDVSGLPDSLSPYAEETPATDVDARLDPDSLEVYACGINAMVYRLEEAVRALEVPTRHVHGEGYG